MCLNSDQLDYCVNWFKKTIKNNGNCFEMSLLSSLVKITLGGG